nr:hypothetical protein [Tanacetum cinerariifolium]
MKHDDDDVVVEVMYVQSLRFIEAAKGRDIVAQAIPLPTKDQTEDVPRDSGVGDLGNQGRDIVAQAIPLPTKDQTKDVPRDSSVGDLGNQEWEEPHDPRFHILSKEFVNDPAVCRAVVDQFPTPIATLKSQSKTFAASVAKVKEKSKGTKKLLKSQDKAMRKLTAEAFKLKQDLLDVQVKDLKDTLAKQESELLGLRDKVATDEKIITEFRIGITSFFRIGFETMVRIFLQSDEFNRLQGEGLALDWPKHWLRFPPPEILSLPRLWIMQDTLIKGDNAASSAPAAPDANPSKSHEQVENQVNHDTAYDNSYFSGENVVEISSDKVEGYGDWNSLEFQDTANNGKKKETKTMVFHQMVTKEVSDRFVDPCFVNVKIMPEHEVKRGNKVVKKELIVTLRGEIYFVKFIINPEEDDVEARVILGRSFLHDVPVLGGEGLPPFVCIMGKSSHNKKRAMENLNLFYQDIGTSSSAGGHLTQEEATKEALAI